MTKDQVTKNPGKGTQTRAKHYKMAKGQVTKNPGEV